MRTFTVKIDDALVHAVMKKGNFQKPEEAITYGLNKVLESTMKKKKEVTESDFLKTLSKDVQSLLNYGFDSKGKTDDELLRDALEEKHSK